MREWIRNHVLTLLGLLLTVLAFLGIHNHQALAAWFETTILGKQFSTIDLPASKLYITYPKFDLRRLTTSSNLEEGWVSSFKESNRYAADWIRYLSNEQGIFLSTGFQDKNFPYKEKGILIETNIKKVTKVHLLLNLQYACDSYISEGALVGAINFAFQSARNKPLNIETLQLRAGDNIREWVSGSSNCSSAVSNVSDLDVTKSVWVSEYKEGQNPPVALDMLIYTVPNSERKKILKHIWIDDLDPVSSPAIVTWGVAVEHNR